MKRHCRIGILIFLLVCLLAFFGVSAEGNSIDLSLLSVQELQDLKSQVDARLYELGAYAYVELQRNDRGEEVISLQNQLRLLGFYLFEPSGKYDNNTQIAQKRFEKAKQLEEDGVASIQDQQLLFSERVTDALPSGPPPSPTPTQEPDPVKQLYQVIDYDDYARYPDEHDQKKVLLKGRVEQVLGSRQEGFQIRLSVLNNVENIIFIFINEDPGYNLLEGDRLTIYARLNKTISYTSVWDQTIVVPSAIAEIVELH